MLLTHTKILNGHRMQIAVDGDGFAAWVCITCCAAAEGVVLFGICDWDDTDPTTQAAQYAVAHSAGVANAR